MEAEGESKVRWGIGWLTPPVAWIRTLVVDGRLPVDEMLQRLLPPLIRRSSARGSSLWR